MFFKTNEELERRKSQRETHRVENPQFRVEFRFKRGTKAWEYYATYEECVNAEDHKRCGYNIFGSPFVEYPSSRQIQQKGKRGGWSKLKAARGE